MAKLYSKNTWTDEVLANAAKYLVKDDDGNTVYENALIQLATEVVTAGSPVNAERMQNIEDGIDALDDLLVALQSKFTFEAATELTIVGGAITTTQTVHKLQPETGTSDDLDTISGLSAGDILILYVSDAGTDTITIKHGTGNISCLGASDVALSHGSAIFYSDGTTVYLIGGGGGGGGLANVVEDLTPQLGGDLDLNTHSILNQSKFVCNGRLTLESGVPISITDQVDKITLYFTPYNGNEISLYDGSNWIRHEFTERSLALGALTASKPHDIFIYNNAGTLTLSATAWTDATTRATALTTQDGVYVKTGALTYRYLGTIYMDAASKCQDKESMRFVWNYYNRVPRKLKITESSDYWEYTIATWRSANNSTANRVQLVVGVSESPLDISVNVITAQTGANDRYVGIGVDSTNTNDADIKGSTSIAAQVPIVSRYKSFPAIGFHFYQWTEKSIAAGTCYWYGDNGLPNDAQSGMLGEVIG